MDKEEIKRAEEVEENKIVKKLELNKGEMYLGELTNKDKFQVLCRHLTVLEQIGEAGRNALTGMMSEMLLLMREMAKKQEIEVDKIIKK